MKYVLCALLLTFALFEVIHSTEFDINNGEVSMNGKKLNLDDLEVVEDTPDHTTYKIEDGNTHAIITRSKDGKGISIESSTNTLTPEEEAEIRKSMDQVEEEMSHLGEDIKHEIDTNLGSMKGIVHFRESAPPFPPYPSSI